MTPYSLGATSEAHLVGVHPNIQKVVRHSILTTPVDYGVHEGLRTLARQKIYVQTGVSWTMESKHLRQADGFGHAVDLVPYVYGELRWEWPLIYPIAAAVRQAAVDLGVRLRWGGVWDRVLNDLPATPEGLKAAVEAYCIRHPGIDRIDGPHYEMVT